MVRNDRGKVECAACGSVKPGAEPNQEQQKYAKALFTFGSGASSSEGVFSFGSFATSQGDPKPGFTFGTLSQTSNSSSEVPFSFGFLNQEGNVSQQNEEDQGQRGSGT